MTDPEKRWSTSSWTPWKILEEEWACECVSEREGAGRQAVPPFGLWKSGQLNHTCGVKARRGRRGGSRFGAKHGSGGLGTCTPPRTLTRSSLSLHHTHTLSPKMRSNSLGRKKRQRGVGCEWEAGGQQFPSYFPSATPLTPLIPRIAGTAVHLTSNDILYSQGCGYITHAPNPNPSALYSGTVRSQLETKGKRRKGLHLKCMRLNYSRV